jgi:autotransporter-associated beta strand protein
MGIVLNGGGHVSANGGAGIVTIYTGSISGSGPLTVDGSGIFRLTTVPATYTGATIINGHLQISTTADVIPNATDMTINEGGSFDLQANETIGSLTGAGDITSVTRTLTVSGSTSPAALTGTVSGPMSLIRSGTGTLTLSGISNSYSGTTTITSGVLAVGSNSALGTSGLSLNGGTLATSGGARTLGNNTTILASSTVTPTNNLQFNGTFTNSGGNRVLSSTTSAGTTTLNGNVFLSELSSTGRSLILAGSGSSNPTFTVTGNVANFNGGAGTAGRIQVGNGSSATAATLNLGGTNTHSGGTNVSTGSLLNITTTGALGSSTLTATGTGSFDNKTGSSLAVSNNMFLLGGSLTFVGTNNMSMGNVAMSGANRSLTTTAGVLTITGITEDIAGRNFTKNGNGTLVLTGAAANTGIYTIGAGGTFQIGNGGATGTLNSGSAITDNGTLAFNRNNLVVQGTDFGTSITGTGSLTQAGSNTLALNSANGFSGATTVSSGKITAGAFIGQALGGTTAITVASGATLGLVTSDQINNLATVALNGGTFETGGLTEGAANTPGVGALSTGASSIIDMGAGTSLLAFADSSTASWTGTLSVYNWSGTPYFGGGTDQLYFGTLPNSGLTAPQLASINFYSDNGVTLIGGGGAMFAASDGSAEVVPVPEPTTLGLLALVAMPVVTRRRRK